MQSENTQSKGTRPDYPALYDAANKASIDSQNDYLLLMKFYIGLTILAAFFSLYIKESKVAGIVAATMFFIIILLTGVQALKRFDKIWYNGRAVAESVKTITWRFIMRAEPYRDNSNLDSVKKDFCKDLNDILEQNRVLGNYLTGESMLKDTITESMLMIRALAFEDRLNFYISNRINEQRNWYHHKASLNKRLAKKWFYGLLTAHILTLVLILIEVSYEIYYLPTTAFIVISGSILTWMQIKRFQDLSSSYSLTAHEIGILKSQNFEVIDESTLSKYVKDAENAFSREHTQWVARKDT